jgi:hypothetical protein
MKSVNTTDPEYWRILAKERINKQLKMNEIHNKEEYQYRLKEFFANSKFGYNIINAGQHKFYADGTKNPNYKKINYRQISEEMYQASIKEIVELPKRKFLSLYRVYEAEYTHVSIKGKVYKQKQYQDIKGRFVKNPFK